MDILGMVVEFDNDGPQRGTVVDTSYSENREYFRFLILSAGRFYQRDAVDCRTLSQCCQYSNHPTASCCD